MSENVPIEDARDAGNTDAAHVRPINDSNEETTLLVGSTGVQFRVQKGIFANPSELRQRVKYEDAQAPLNDDEIVFDIEKRTYRFLRYPSLCGVHWPGLRSWTARIPWLFAIIFGAFFVAAWSQASFYFPCTSGYTPVTFKSVDYCVNNGDLHRVTSTTCPVDVCTKRIPVTMQTYAVLLNGALLGRWGAVSTTIYVLMVAVGAPFGANHLLAPLWSYGGGALGSSSGGYFIGFIFGSLIMGFCAERGEDRPNWRVLWRMIPWMLLSELVIFACGLFWIPFGIAIQANKDPSYACPASQGAGKCLENIFNWGLVPFIPGELLKMLFVLLTVPALWYATMIVSTWWRRRSSAATGNRFSAVAILEATTA